MTDDSRHSVSKGPLAGFRILDLSIALTGPYAVALLADQGADVVKVERPGLGDIARWLGVKVNGVSSLHVMVNRGKRSIAIDVQQPEGAELVRDIASGVDVFVQNFRPGVMEKVGLGYDDVRNVNPNVIYASLSGFGSRGPYRDRSAYDTVIQAYGGFATNQADPTDGAPVFLKQTAADKVTALYASQAITAALLARERGAGGQHLELSMADAVVSFLWADSAGNEVMLGTDHTQHSSFVAGFQPMRFADGWGIVTPTSARDFIGMCRALGAHEWDDPRLATMEARAANREFSEAMMDLCYAHAANLTMAQAIERLEEERVPFSMVLTPVQLVEDPHARAIGLFEERTHELAGPLRMTRHPTLFEKTPATIAENAAALGAHTDEILNELGYGKRITDLRRRHIIA